MTMSELSGLVLGTGLQVRISKHYRPGIDCAIMFGYSTCVISSMNKISECTINRPIFNEGKILQSGIFCNSHLIKGKFGGIVYYYCNIIKTFPSRNNLFRTVKVAYFYFKQERKDEFIGVMRLYLSKALCIQSTISDYTVNIKIYWC